MGGDNTPFGLGSIFWPFTHKISGCHYFETIKEATY